MVDEKERFYYIEKNGSELHLPFISHQMDYFASFVMIFPEREGERGGRKSLENDGKRVEDTFLGNVSDFIYIFDEILKMIEFLIRSLMPFVTVSLWRGSFRRTW